MEWLNEPREWRQTGDEIAFRAEAATDFWRITYDGQVRDNGHLFYDTVAGDCTIEAYVEGELLALYDQVGLMLRADDRQWVKCGIENLSDGPYRSVVVTREFSDWSIVENGGRSGLWVRLERRGTTIETFTSQEGKSYSLFRQTYFPDTNPVSVGVMAASPTGMGFQARFRQLSLR